MVQTRDDLLTAADPEVAAAIAREAARQRDTLEMIASENYASPAVLAAMGSILTNKYAEGYPGRRYYGGCEFIDETETLAIERAKTLFGAEHANVQPHSGAQANLAAYYALMEPGDAALGMELSHGGHLTHGLPVNFSGRWFHFTWYGVDSETERIDYDAMARLAREHRPKVIVVGATAYPRQYDFARSAEIAESVGATLVADMAHVAGLVAAGLHPSPVGFAPVITSTTHKTLRGPRSAFILTNAAMATRVDRGRLPRHVRRPASAHHRRQGRRLQRGAVRRVPRLLRGRDRERAGPGGRAPGRGAAPGLRRHREPPLARGRGGARAHRPRGGGRAGGERDHRQQEHYPVRHPKADGDERHPHRHAGH